MRYALLLALLGLAGGITPANATSGQTNAVVEASGMARVPAGLFAPFFQPNPGKGKAPVSAKPVQVNAFSMDTTPVTNAQFLAFTQNHAEWRKSRVKRLFAEAHYLQNWTSDDDFGGQSAASKPVTNVSWFAARAYCKAQGKSLPTTDQWEYALADGGHNRDEISARALDWFGAPNPAVLSDVGQTEANSYGIRDLVGLVWEWTLDFDSFMTGTEQRNTDSKDSAQFCGNGSTGVRDATDYPGFMRYALRTSLKAAYTTDNVGFRCVGDDHE